MNNAVAYAVSQIFPESIVEEILKDEDIINEISKNFKGSADALEDKMGGLCSRFEEKIEYISEDIAEKFSDILWNEMKDQLGIDWEECLSTNINSESI